VKAISDRAVQVLDEVKSASRKLNDILASKDVSDTLANVSAATGVFKKVSTEREPDLQAFVKDLPGISSSLRSSAEELDKMLQDRDVQELVQNINKTAHNSALAAADLQRLLRRIDQLVASEQQSLRSAGTDLRRAMENIDALTQDAAQNPARLIFGKPPAPIKLEGESK
jgi:ABC-type transporter Mla subunit MlaD